LLLLLLLLLFYQEVLPNVMVPDFQPSEGVKIATSDAEAKTQVGGDGGGNALDLDRQCQVGNRRGARRLVWATLIGWHCLSSP